MHISKKESIIAINANFQIIHQHQPTLMFFDCFDFQKSFVSISVKKNFHKL